MMSLHCNTKFKLMSLMGLIILFQVIGGSIGWMTSKQIDGWYQTLEKSPLTPPDYLFGVVWSFLYILLAIVIWVILEKPKTVEKTYILLVFGLHMILNWAWSFVFFLAHALLASALLLFVILITGIYLAVLIHKHYGLISLALTPYLFWLSFAGYLSFYILIYT